MLSKITLQASTEALQLLSTNKQRLVVHAGSPLETLVNEFSIPRKEASIESLIEEVSPMTSNPMVGALHADLVEESIDPVVSKVSSMVNRGLNQVLPLVKKLEDQLTNAIDGIGGWTMSECSVNFINVRRERSLDIPQVTSELDKIRNLPKPPRKIFCPLLEGALAEMDENAFPFLDFGVDWVNNVVQRDVYVFGPQGIKETLLKGNSEEFSPLEGTYLSDEDVMYPQLFELINFFYWYQLRNTSQDAKIVETATVNTEYWIYLLSNKISMMKHLQDNENIFFTPLVPDDLAVKIRKAVDTESELLIPVMASSTLKMEGLNESNGLFNPIVGYVLNGGSVDSATVTSVLAKGKKNAEYAKNIFETKNRMNRMNSEFVIKQAMLATFRSFMEENSAFFTSHGVNVSDPAYVTDTSSKVTEYMRMFTTNKDEFLLTISNVMVSIIILNDEPVYELINRLSSYGKINFGPAEVQAVVLATVMDHYMLQTLTVQY